jgi:hypothetical protein
MSYMQHFSLRIIATEDQLQDHRTNRNPSDNELLDYVLDHIRNSPNCEYQFVHNIAEFDEQIAADLATTASLEIP